MRQVKTKFLQFPVMSWSLESYATILIGMAEVLTTVWTETQTYPLSAVISGKGQNSTNQDR